MGPMSLHPHLVSNGGGGMRVAVFQVIIWKAYCHSMKGGTLYSNSESLTPIISLLGTYRTMHYFGRG